MVVYYVLNIIFAVWVGIDSSDRKSNTWVWSILTLFFGGLVIAVYIAVRPLKENESRKGGRAWNILKNFAIFWTAQIITVSLYLITGISNIISGSVSEIEFILLGFGGFVFLILFAVVLIVPVVIALTIGLLLRKKNIIETWSGNNISNSGGQNTVVQTSNNLQASNVSQSAAKTLKIENQDYSKATEIRYSIYFKDENMRSKKFSFSEVMQLLKTKQISEMDYITSDNLSHWIFIKDCNEFKNKIQG